MAKGGEASLGGLGGWVERSLEAAGEPPWGKLKIRGRDAHYWAPPAQIRASGIPAHGSYLGCLTANRWLGQG